MTDSRLTLEDLDKEEQELVKSLERNMSNVIHTVPSETLNKFANVKLKYDKTLLHRAVANDDLKSAARLIEAGSELNAKTTHGNYPIHYAGSSGMIDLLKNHGADLSVKDGTGCPPMVAACMTGSFYLIRHFLKFKNLDRKPLNEWIGLPEFSSDEEIIDTIYNQYVFP